MIYVLLTYPFYPFVWIVTWLRRRREVRNILVVQTAKIGDLICATPIFRALAEHFPAAHLTALVNPVARDLLDGNRHVDAVIAVGSDFTSGFVGKCRLTRLVYKGRYDVAVCLNPNVPFAIGLFWGLVPTRLSVMPNFAGRTFRLASGLFTHLARHVTDRLVLETYVEMLKNIGVGHVDLAKEVVQAPGADRKVDQLLAGAHRHLVGIAVSSANKLKQLPAATVARIVELMRANEELSIVFIGSAQDRRDAAEILSLLRDTDNIVDAVGKLTLSELPALLKRVSVFVGVDSGLTYMADACRTRVVQIAGPVNTREQRPMGEACVIISRELPCAPCSHVFRTVRACRIKTRECIESVTANEICDAVNDLLNRSDRRNQSKHSIFEAPRYGGTN